MIAANRKKKIEGVGISLPGRYNHTVDRLVFAPNLHWQDVDIRNPIAKATGLEVTVENAANACVLAAVWFDHMEDCRNLVVVTVSEGIGTGHLGQRPTGARPERHGGRVRPCAARPQRTGLRLRRPRLLGGVRVQSRGPPLLSGIDARSRET